MTPLELVLAVVDCGFVVELDTHGQPTLIRTQDGATVPPELLSQLKANRYAVRAWILSQTDPVECSVCKRDLSDPEDRERVQDALFCSQGGASEQHNKRTGEIVAAMVPRCPFKKRAA